VGHPLSPGTQARIACNNGAIRSPSTNPKLRFKRFEHQLTTARLDLAPTPL